ncbi:hypothetical protein JXB02_00020 [Candidatus Woesearchaeota archaeon]|nr:hypothetical protein [Candidatus Woesearchaeota archaeon]
MVDIVFRNLLGKKDEGSKDQQTEVEELRRRFKELGAQNAPSEKANEPEKEEGRPAPEIKVEDSLRRPGEAPKVAEPASSIRPAAKTTPNARQPERVAMVEPQVLAKSEHMTNLVMEQIRELIEIDNNLNNKIKEVDTKLVQQESELSGIKKLIEQYQQRMDLIDRNMERFMALYEVVTNQYNPFVEGGKRQEGEGMSTSDAAEKAKAVLEGRKVEPKKEEKPADEPKPVEQKRPEAPASELASPPVKPGPEPTSDLPKELVKEIERAVGHQMVLAFENFSPTLDYRIKDNVHKAMTDFSRKIEDAINTQLVAAVQEEVTRHEGPVSNGLDLERLKETIDERIHETIRRLVAEESEAEQFVDDSKVAEGEHFTTKDGREAHSVKELVAALKEMDDEAFGEHVNEFKNDFAQWVMHSVKNYELATKLYGLTRKDDIIATLEKESGK